MISRRSDARRKSVRRTNLAIAPQNQRLAAHRPALRSCRLSRISAFTGSCQSVDNSADASIRSAIRADQANFAQVSFPTVPIGAGRFARIGSRYKACRYPANPNVGTAQGARPMTGLKALRYWVRKQNESVESTFDGHQEPEQSRAGQADRAGGGRHCRGRPGARRGHLRQQTLVRNALCRARTQRCHPDQHRAG
ncbi:hypothetical protein D9M68_242030 [compost metagenome]